MSKLTHVVKRSHAIVPFNRERIVNAIYRAAVAVGGRDRARAEFLADEVIQYLEQNIPEGQAPNIEEIQDAVEKILIEHGHASVAKAYILYRNEQLLKRKRNALQAAQSTGNIPWRKIYYVLDWAIEHRLHTIASLNQRIRSGEFPQIVHESESAYEDNVTAASEWIHERQGEVRVVIVSGPSSSGKTTTTIKLEQRLKKRGLRFRALNVDNYFFDLELHPKDEFGDYDFETPQALDLALINQHLDLLLQGEEVLIPFYDFKSGTRKLDQTPLRLGKDEILLIDSLHGLYPKMTESIPDEQKARIFLEPLMQMKLPNGEYIQWADLRLIRRMLRDSVHRAYDPQRTLEHWHYVRSSEMRHIIPYIGTTDIIINSAMPYEIALYRPKLLQSFQKWEQLYRDDPLREDAFQRATRVKQMLESVEPVEDDSAIPGDSVLREFIGGSTLSY
ncbi:MAG: response regulator SirA [Anaerolineales bacterium]|nr:MAG: response regulator SirA [Anaerolineales bacterium]